MFGRVPTTLFNSSFVNRDTYRLVCDVWKYPQNANVFLQFFCNRKRFNCVWTKNGSMINCQNKNCRYRNYQVSDKCNYRRFFTISLKFIERCRNYLVSLLGLLSLDKALIVSGSNNNQVLSILQSVFGNLFFIFSVTLCIQPTWRQTI